MSKKISSVLSAFLFVGVVATTGSAFYATQTTKKDVVPSFDLIGSEYIVTQIGIPGNGEFKQFSFGNEIPIPIAMKMVLPVKWAYAFDDVDKTTSVTWERNDNWLTNLENIGRGSDLRFLVDWNTKKVFIGKSGNTAKWADDDPNNATTLAGTDNVVRHQVPAKPTKKKFIKVVAPIKNADNLVAVKVLANQVSLIFNGKPKKVTHFIIPNPDRLVVDVHGVTTDRKGKFAYDLTKDIDGMSRVRIGIHPDKLRFVFDPMHAGTMPDTSINYPDDKSLTVGFNDVSYSMAQTKQQSLDVGQSVTVIQKPLLIKKGLLRNSLTEFAKHHGYELAWELENNKMYYLQFPFEVDSLWTMEQQMTKIQDAINQNGNRIKLIAWQDNKVLQVCYF